MAQKLWSKSKDKITQIAELSQSEQVTEIMQNIKTMVEDRIHAKGIPTLIYDGKKHNGLYKVIRTVSGVMFSVMVYIVL